MKSNLAAIILVLACLGFGIFLWTQNQREAVKAKHLSDTIISQSARITNLEESLSQQQLTNTMLETNLATAQIKYSNELAAAEASLSATAANYDKAQADAKNQAQAVAAASAALAEKQKKIDELEGQNRDLDKESSDLRADITNLNVRIEAAKSKLDAAEGDKKLLLAELQKLEAQRRSWKENSAIWPVSKSRSGC
jgi:chromosome segregation ATPase